MKILALVVLGTIVVFTPVPRQSADHGGDAAKKPAAKGNTSEKPAALAPAILQKDCKSDAFKDDPDCKPAENKETTVTVSKLPTANVSIQRNAKRDLPDWIAWGFGVLLAIAGMFGVRLAYGTLRAIERQALSMRRQTTHLRRSVIWARRSANAAKKSADAAKASADAFVLSERAWIQLHITKQPEVQVSLATAQDGGTRHTTERVWFWPDVMNFGRTPAKMTEIIVVTCVIPKPLGIETQMPPELPPEPKYDADEQRRVIGIKRDMMLAPNMGITPIPIEVKKHEWERIISRKSTLYLYGFIDYMDVVNKPHQTRFCEVYWVRVNPDDPNKPGFVVAGNTPAAYTEST